MAIFDYKVLDSAGKVSDGKLDATDKKAAATVLRKQGMTVVSLRQAAETSRGGAKGKASKIRGGEKIALVFFRKLYQLCKTGTPVGDALRGLSHRSLNKSLLKLSKELYKSLSEGRSLSSSIADYPEIFEKSIVHLVEAGETTANLVPVFDNIIDYLEGRRDLRKKVSAALIYPMVLFGVALAVVMLFLFVLLPQIDGMMKSLGGEMNLPVKILMAFGSFLIYGGPFILAGIVLAVLLVHMARQTPKGLLFTDRLILKAPLFGAIVKDSDVCRLSNLLSTLFSSGVNTTEAFRLTEKSLKNSDMRLRFQQCRMAVNDGMAVALAFKKFKILDDDDIDIISVGDRTGNLMECFVEIRNAHIETLGEHVKFAITVLSGVALISAFVLVFIIALGIVSAVLNLSENLIK